MAETTGEELQKELAPNYEYLRELGSGMSGRVVLCRDTRLSGRLVAIKLIPRGSFIKTFHIYIAREIAHHGSLMHPLIIGCYEAFLTPHFLCLAMEWAPGGSLHSFINKQPGCRFPEVVARTFFQQLIIGLQYVHLRGVANRDMKLENLLLDSEPSTDPSAPCPFVKICDFGYSKHSFNSLACTNVGTPIYMAPEIIKGSNLYDPFATDIWSAGVVLYAMLAGRYPFDRDECGNVLIRQVVMGEWAKFHPDLGVSSEAEAIVQGMLQPEPKLRLKLEEIIASIWFQQGLPPGATDINDFWLDVAPRADQPPLSLLPPLLNVLIERAQEEGVPGDPEDAVRCEFPCLEVVKAAIRNGKVTDGLSTELLGEVFDQLDFPRTMKNGPPPPLTVETSQAPEPSQTWAWIR